MCLTDLYTIQFFELTFSLVCVIHYGNMKSEEAEILRPDSLPEYAAAVSFRLSLCDAVEGSIEQY